MFHGGNSLKTLSNKRDYTQPIMSHHNNHDNITSILNNPADKRHPTQRISALYYMGVITKKICFCHEKQTQYIDSMLVQCWATVFDAIPTLNQHRFNVSCLLGQHAMVLSLLWANISWFIFHLKLCLAEAIHNFK